MVEKIIPVQHKYSSTAGVVPTADDLLVAQIAINLADKKLFSKTEDNEIIVFEGGGSSGGGSESIEVVTYDTGENGYSANTKITVPQYSLGIHAIQIFADGMLLLEEQAWQEVDETTIELLEDIASNTKIAIYVRVVVSHSVQVTNIDVGAQGLEKDSQLTVPEYELSVNAMQVYIDGLLLIPGEEFSEVDETTIKVLEDVPANTTITIYTRS